MLNSRQSQLRDHPRLRGEYRFDGLKRRLELGSPPLTRGIHLSVRYRFLDLSITPAYAGNTPIASVNIPVTDHHPRLRGEYTGT